MWPQRGDATKISDKDLALYLNFDEGEGTKVKDLSGNLSDGVINGKFTSTWGEIKK